MSVIQFDVIPAAAGAGEGAEERASIAAAVLSMVGAMVAHRRLSGTGRLLGRHLTAHSTVFAHRMAAPLMRRLLSAAQGAESGSAASERAACRHLRTIRWLLHHSPEIRSVMWPLCSEWLLRALRFASASNGQLGAAALATAVASGALATPAADALGALGPDVHDVIRAALVSESLIAPLDEGPRRQLECLGLWEDAVAWTSESATSDAGMGCQGMGPEVPHIGTNSDDDHNQVGNASGEFDAPSEFQLAPPGETMGACCWPEVMSSPVAITAAGGATMVLREAPANFRCSIDGRICRDPCRSPAGVLFERQTIELWLRRSSFCPVGGQALSVSELVPDDYTRAEIAEWLNIWLM